RGGGGCAPAAALRRRRRQLAPPLDQLAREAGIAEARLVGGCGDTLLARQLLLEALALLAQALRQALELRHLPALLVELPAMDADEAVERAHTAFPGRSAPTILASSS